MPLIYCQINFILTWSEKCVLTSKLTRDKFIGTGIDENHNFLKLIIQQMQHLK